MRDGQVTAEFLTYKRYMMTISSLQSIAHSGGSVIVDAGNFTTSSLKSIAYAGQATGAELIIKGASGLTSSSCQSIASANPGHVTFDFT